MADLQAELNRLAGTEGLDAAGAANAGAGTSGLELVGALNAWAGTSGLELNGACRALAGVLHGDVTKDGPGALVSALEPLLAEAVWVVRADRNGSGAAAVPEMRDLVGGLSSTPPEPNPKIVGPTSFAGVAAIGRMALTGGYDDAGDWLTDVDVRFRASVLPHHDNDDLTHWAETFNIPNTGDGGVTDYAEAALLLRNDGGIGVGYDWDASVSDPNQWDPADDVDLGVWSDGLPVHDYRITIVAATGVLTLYQDDEEIHAETLGAVAFDEPDDESAVLVGPANTGLLAVYSVEVLDGIDGDPLFTFDAEDPTGWEAHSTGGMVTAAPSRAAWAGYNAAVGTAPPHTFDGVGTFAAEESVTIVVHLCPLGIVQGGWLAVGLLNLFGGGEGWAFLNVPGFGLANQVRMSDGTNTISASLGTLDQGADVVQVAVLDRAEDELRTYVDGVLVDTADASSLGAVDVASALEVFGGNCWGYGAAIFDRAFTADEVAALNGVWD